MLKVYFANGPLGNTNGELPDFKIHQREGVDYQAKTYAALVGSMCLVVEVAFVLGTDIPTNPPDGAGGCVWARMNILQLRQLELLPISGKLKRIESALWEELQ